MKVHMVVKIYSNGASAIQKVFGSKKRAWDWLNKWAEASEKDGFEVVEINDDPILDKALLMRHPVQVGYEHYTVITKEVE